MFPRRLIAIACALCVLGGVATARAATQQDAEHLINGLTQEAVTMASNKLSGQQKEERFRQLLHNSFDLPEIGRFVLGRFWRTTSAEQQREFLRLFEDLTVLTWVRRFDDYGGETISVISTIRDGDGMVIETKVNRTKGPSIPVTWRVREAGGRLRVVDIVVEGVSMAITHRSEYTAAVQSTGNIDGLLGAMRKKIAVLRGDSRG